MIVYKTDKSKENFLSSYNFEGKSVTIFQYLKNAENILNVPGEIDFAEDLNQKDFCDKLNDENYYQNDTMVVIYTDIPENELICMKHHLKEIEKSITNVEFFLLCKHEDWSY